MHWNKNKAWALGKWLRSEVHTQPCMREGMKNPSKDPAQRRRWLAKSQLLASCVPHTLTVSLSGTLYTLNVRAIYTCHHLFCTMYQCSMKTPSWDVAHIYRFAVVTLSWRISLYVAGGRSAGGLAGGSRACGAHALPAGMQRAEHDLSKICHTVAVILLPPHC